MGNFNENIINYLFGKMVNHKKNKKMSDTPGHSLRVAYLAKAIAKEMNLPKWYQEDLFIAGKLHDIGKIKIPVEILEKTEQLTDEEFEEMKNHTVYGYNILKQYENTPRLVTEVALHHHEAFEGDKGYPEEQLNGINITLASRIISMVDIFDALRSPRKYKESYSIEKCIEIMSQEEKIDNRIFEVFKKKILDKNRININYDKVDKEYLPLIDKTKEPILEDDGTIIYNLEGMFIKIPEDVDMNNDEEFKTVMDSVSNLSSYLNKIAENNNLILHVQYKTRKLKLVLNECLNVLNEDNENFIFAYEKIRQLSEAVIIKDGIRKGTIAEIIVNKIEELIKSNKTEDTIRINPKYITYDTIKHTYFYYNESKDLEMLLEEIEQIKDIPDSKTFKNECNNDIINLYR